MHRKVTLFIAMSLDGYIADKTGGTDWLGGLSPEGDDFQTYRPFYDSVSTLLMGMNTYRQISAGDAVWPYTGKEVYVFTHCPGDDLPGIHFTKETPVSLLKKLYQEVPQELPKEKNSSFKPSMAPAPSGIWVVGGAATAAPLIEADLIDCYHLNIMPVLLGDGIPLFSRRSGQRRLRPVKTVSYNGIVDLIYEVER